MTLVELLVVMAVGTVVLGLLLKTFDETQMLSRREIARNAQRQAATLTLERISAIVAGAIPAGSLDTASQVAETFESDHLRVISWQGADSDNIWAHGITTVTADDATGESHVTLVRFDLQGQEVGSETPIERVSTAASFRYAAVVKSDGSIDWQNSMPATSFPALIEIRVTAQAEGAEQAPVEVSTVIPTGAEVGS